MQLSLNKELLKKQAKIMQEFIRLENGEKMKLSNCYECIAKMWGYKNWNTLSANLKECEYE
jgi:hypothetical protein